MEDKYLILLESIHYSLMSIHVTMAILMTTNIIIKIIKR